MLFVISRSQSDEKSLERKTYSQKDLSSRLSREFEMTMRFDVFSFNVSLFFMFQFYHIALNFCILSSTGGCVEKNLEMFFLFKGLEINKWAVAGPALAKGMFVWLIFSSARAKPSG